MSLKAARNWLSDHPAFIPAFDVFHDQVIHLLNQEVATLADIADVIMLDPGMSTLLLQRVNSKLKKRKHACVDTVHTALGHLGKPATTNLVIQHKKLSEVCPHKAAINSYRQLLSERYHALVQLDVFTRMQGINTVDDMRSAVLLHNIAELHICISDPDNYQRYRARLKSSEDEKSTAMEIFGFEFDQLGKVLAQEWALPELVIDSFESSERTGRKSSLIQLAAAIAHFAELGWYHKAMYETQKRCAYYLKIDREEASRSIHSAAIMAARSSPITCVFPAAARLILLPNAKPVEILRPVATTQPPQKLTPPIPLDKQLKALLKNPGVNQSDIFSLLLSGLQKDLSFSRVVLMILSTDKNKLVTKASKGLESKSAFNKFQLEIAQSGLIKSLLQKPQALCVDASNYKKYENLLPGNLKAVCLSNNFVMMSIFIGSNPVGLLYCDRQHIEKPIDSRSYMAFKSSVMMTSKVLTYLVKNKIRAIA